MVLGAANGMPPWLRQPNGRGLVMEPNRLLDEAGAASEPKHTARLHSHKTLFALKYRVKNRDAFKPD